jgi:hypothetical protein
MSKTRQGRLNQAMQRTAGTAQWTVIEIGRSPAYLARRAGAGETFQSLPINARLLISDRRIRPAHLPPKNLRNDLKTRPGKENAFCGAPWSC